MQVNAALLWQGGRGPGLLPLRTVVILLELRNTILPSSPNRKSHVQAPCPRLKTTKSRLL